MSNPVYQAMNGKQQAPNMMEQFSNFMNAMRGRDPNQMLHELVSSGRISQEQLNQAQQRARQMASLFEPMREQFGK